MTSRATQNLLNQRASALAALSKHPSWPEFEAELQRKIERLRKTAMTLALDEQGADQRKLDQIRGSIGALRWMLGVPKTSQTTLERFLREAGLEAPDEH